MRIIRRCCHVTALLHHSYACTSSRVAAAQMHPADVNDMAVPPAIILQQVPVAKGLMLWALLSSRVRGPTPTATLGSQHRVSLWVMPPPPCTPVSVHAPPSWGTAASQLHHHTVSAVPCPQAVWMHSMRQPLQELIMCGSDHGSSRRLGGPGRHSNGTLANQQDVHIGAACASLRLLASKST
jgi:hypothetical protein